MKKIIGIAAALGAFVLLTFSSCGGGGSSKMTNELDSVSYGLGLELGQYIKNIQTRVGEDVNLNVVLGAIKDVLADAPKMTNEEAYAFLQEFFVVKMPAKALIAGQEFLAGVEKDNKNVVKAESGLIYEIIEGGDQSIKAVKDNDIVRVTYEGKLKDGTVFDSSIERGDTAEFPLNRVIKGWTEGMKLVGKGGKVKLWIPAELGYGEQGQSQIGPNEPLVFEVTIVDVIPAEEEIVQ